jgi:hypothetical protein
MRRKQALERKSYPVGGRIGLPAEAHRSGLHGEPGPPGTAEVAQRLSAAMVPVEPSTAFVRSLGKELLETARQQQQAARRVRRGVVIGAAAVGSALSVAGLVTLILLRRRPHLHAGPASG